MCKIKLLIFLICWYPFFAQAEHSWNDFHWARMSNPFTLQIIDSTTSTWDPAVVEAISLWSESIVVQPAITSANSNSRVRRDCSIVKGRLKVCNYNYGITGWYGQTVVWIDPYGHISGARIKLNDSYSGFWNTVRRNHVACHEMGHVFGLWHTTADGTCLNLDYSDTEDQGPNAHDFEQIEIQNDHYDTYNSYDDGGLFNALGALKEPSSKIEEDIIKHGHDGGKRRLISHGNNHKVWMSEGENGNTVVYVELIAPEDK